jgi:hypothetical protein
MTVLTVPELEAIRRSAAMAPLSPDAMAELLDTCEQLLRERARAVELVAELRPAWGAVREALNGLARTVGGAAAADNDGSRGLSGSADC